MDAVTVINNHIDIVKLMEHYGFDKISEKGSMVRACCKIHGGDNPTGFVADPNTGLWYCHTGDCGGGDVYTLVQLMEECTFQEAVNFVADFFNVDIEGMEIVERVESYKQELQKFVKTMLSRKKESIPEFKINAETRDVARFRGFKEETLQYFELKYVESIQCEKRNGEHYTLKHRLLFPIKQNGKLVGISLRKIHAKDFPKWLHQPASIETNRLLYNYDNVIGKPEVAVCEGITDVWAFHEINVPAVCTFGAHLTEEQYKMLIRTGADIILAYDGDDAGESATKKAIELLKFKANVYKIQFDEGEDPENISREQLKQKYEGKIRLC